MHGGCFNTNNGVEALYFVHNLALLCTYVYCKESEEIKCEKSCRFKHRCFAKNIRMCIKHETNIYRTGKKIINYKLFSSSRYCYHGSFSI